MDTKQDYQISQTEFWIKLNPNANSIYVNLSKSPNGSLPSLTNNGNHCQTIVPPAAPLPQALQPAQQGGQQVTQASLISQRDKQLGQLVNSFFSSSISLSQSGNYIVYQVFSYSADYEKVRYIYQVLKENPTYLNLGTINDLST